MADTTSDDDIPLGQRSHSFEAIFDALSLAQRNDSSAEVVWSAVHLIIQKLDPYQPSHDRLTLIREAFEIALHEWT